MALRFCWAVLGAPTGTRLAPVMVELVATLRCFGELEVSDEVAALLVVMSPATMDRRLAPDRLAPDRAAMTLRGRSHTKPGSLPHQTGVAVQGPDPDPDLGAVGRHGAQVR